jgi:hypothetical protein
LWWRLKDGPM